MAFAQNLFRSSNFFYFCKMLNLTSQHNITNNFCCGDKSISHRALILAAISNGKCVLHNLSMCLDVLTTADCLRTLGAKVEFCGTTATVWPIAKPQSGVILNCKNSGTTARLLAGLVAGLGVEATFVGDKSLSQRPMGRILQPLSQMGAKFTCGEDILFKNLPSKLHGAKLTAEVNSAQVKSGVLLAALFAEGQTEYTENLPTRNHTEILLKNLGADINFTNSSIRVAKSSVSAFEMQIPNDTSSAAFLIALALLDGTSHVFGNVCVNPRRSGFLRVLQKSGANVFAENVREVFGETVADIRAEKSCLQPLFATEKDVCDAIDEIPVLAALALATKGTHTFCGVSELRFKECNRIDAILQMANACGQKAFFDGANLTIQTDGTVTHKPCFNCFADHRMAMSHAVLALSVCGGGSIVGEAAVTFDNFADNTSTAENPKNAAAVERDERMVYEADTEEFFAFDDSQISLEESEFHCGTTSASENFSGAPSSTNGNNVGLPENNFMDFAVSFPNFLQAVGVNPLRLGLVGQSVANSLSPILMSQLARSADVCCSYTPVQLPPDIPDKQLGDVVSQFDGVNVTMPFKTRVSKLFKGSVPAVNTVGKRIEPTSTDGYGIVQSLKAHGINFENQPLWIVGAGGAAESCIAELKPYGCKMQVVNRTLEHAETLSRKYNLQKVADPVGVLSFVPECDFERQLVLPQSVKFVFTAFYKNQSGLERQALLRGIEHVDGLEMLFHQGAKSFALWTNTEIQTDCQQFLNFVAKLRQQKVTQDMLNNVKND